MGDIVTPKMLVDLVIRYWGIGEPLINDEREILLMTLMMENKRLGGSLVAEAENELGRRGVQVPG